MADLRRRLFLAARFARVLADARRALVNNEPGYQPVGTLPDLDRAIDAATAELSAAAREYVEQSSKSGEQFDVD